MYFLKRAYKYLINKKGRTILLGIIFLIIANFVLAGLLVQSASLKAEEQTRLSIGSDITYIFDWDIVLEAYEKGIFTRQEMGTLKTGMSQEIVNLELFTENGGPTYKNFLEAVDSEYVKTYDMSVSFGIASEEGYENYVLDVDGAGSTNSFDAKLFAGVEPQDFKNGNAELIEGRFATAEEISSGASVALIEQNVIKNNNLKIGDIFSVKTILEDYDDTIIDYEIIGIYTSNEEFDVRGKGGPVSLPHNRIYVPFNTLFTIGMKEDYVENILLTSNVIYIEDPTYIDEYRTEVDGKMDMKYGRLDANDTLYNSLIGPIENLGYISKILVLIISIAGALIIGLITALTINERKEEIGVLLAIGESKIKIVSQFVIEVVVIAVIAFVLSTFTGSFIGSNISNLVLDSELLQGETEEVNEKATFLGGKTGNLKQEEIEKIKEQDATIDISLDITVLLQLLGLGLLLSITSTAVPSLYVMRFNPKQILTNRNS